MALPARMDDTEGMETPYEIRFYVGSDCLAVAEAEDLDGAVCAARTLWQDDVDAMPIQGREKSRSVVFAHEGNPCLRWGRRP
jgi:hypothetical protein